MLRGERDDVLFSAWFGGLGSHVVAGETQHSIGRRGALLAKQYLDRTTRINADLVNPDGMAQKKLRVKNAKSENTNSMFFSYDLGGNFLHGDFEGQDFLAEVKLYKNDSDLGTHWTAFLAHCYRAVATEHHMADQFFWISFAPYGGSKWDRMTDVEEIEKAVLNKKVRDVNFTEDQEPAEEYSAEIAKTVSERLWILILSEKQVKHLTMTKEHQALVDAHIIANAEEVT
jgi:hypothetical protein